MQGQIIALIPFWVGITRGAVAPAASATADRHKLVGPGASANHRAAELPTGFSAAVCGLLNISLTKGTSDGIPAARPQVSCDAGKLSFNHFW